jgi:3-deoxy-manno-octulosonate cytidylyltransferase (CMP-KDO synthetase)
MNLKGNELIILIPSRMESTRFPGKPLAPISGVPMVVRCAKNAQGSGYSTFICTDSEMVIETSKRYGVNTIKTPDFATGTDRVNWASAALGADYVINLQGDEPLISSQAIRSFGEEILNSEKNADTIYNGIVMLENEKAYDPNNVKVAVRLDGSIAYLSRKAIRGETSGKTQLYQKQLGLYGFYREALHTFAKMEQSPLELAERIEMLRWIDNGNTLRSISLQTPSVSVDTPEDLGEAEKELAKL